MSFATFFVGSGVVPLCCIYIDSTKVVPIYLNVELCCILVAN